MSDPIGFIPDEPDGFVPDEPVQAQEAGSTEPAQFAELRPYTMLQQVVADSLPQTPSIKGPPKTSPTAMSDLPIGQQIAQQSSLDTNQGRALRLAQQRQLDELARQERARQYRQRVQERQQMREEYGPARDIAMAAANNLTFGMLPEIAHLTTRAAGTPIPASEFQTDLEAMDPRWETLGNVAGLAAGAVAPSPLEIGSQAVRGLSSVGRRVGGGVGQRADELMLAARDIAPERISATLNRDRIREAASVAAPPMPFSREVPVYGQARRYRSAMAGDSSLRSQAAREMQDYDQAIEFVMPSSRPGGDPVALNSSRLRELRSAAFGDGADAAYAREVASAASGSPVTNPNDVHEAITSLMESQVEDGLGPQAAAKFRTTDRKYQISEILRRQGTGMVGESGLGINRARTISRTAQAAAGRAGRMVATPVESVSDWASAAQQNVERIMNVRPQIFGEFAPTIREAQRRGTLAAQMYHLSAQPEFRSILEDIEEETSQQQPEE